MKTGDKNYDNAEKLELLKRANEAYREGNPIMGDAEYDELEKELELENTNEIGEKHSPEMTIRHPFIMGSLSKIQVHAEKDDSVDWGRLLKELRRYIGSKEVIVTPKYDGCSFEAYFKDGQCVSVSTRGDGLWGRDISKHIYNKIPDSYKHLSNEYAPEGTYTLRGEILINKNVFEKKWSNEYVNTRAFVAGVTGQDYDANDYKLLQKLNDLSIVIYDFRTKHDLPFNDGWYDEGWMCLPKSDVLPHMYIKKQIGLMSELKDVYNKFEAYREACPYSLDGFVIKPVDREQDFENARPKDCVAFKFLPMTAVTEVTRIEWSLGKTGEYFPVVYYKPVMMDGKECVKASGHNWGTLVEKGIAPGAKITISMAGDIIPYIYKVLEPVDVRSDRTLQEELLSIPEGTYRNMCHLMKQMDEQEIRIEEFRNSCVTLNVPGLGDSQIAKLVENLKIECQPDEFFGDQGKEFPMTIFELYPSAIERHIGGKNGQKIAKAYQDILSNISLETIIETLNFRFCGKKVSKAVAKYLTTGESDFESMATLGWYWATDKTCDKYHKLMWVLKCVGKDIQYYSTIAAQKAEADKHAGTKTLIIMTGEPNDYPTKADFLKAHPEYEETTSWKKVQIVFTNSLDSNTGKMKKAREKNIEIKVY